MANSYILGFFPVYEARQLFNQFFLSSGNDRQAMLERLPPLLEGIGGVIQIDAVLLKKFCESNRGLAQLILVPGRERENQFRRLSQSRWFFRHPFDRLVTLQDNVRIRPACAERADSRAKGKPHSIHFLRFPVFQLLYDVERRMSEIDEFVQLGGMQRRHKLTMLHLQKDLRNANDPGRCFQVAYVGLDRTDRAGLIFYIVGAEGVTQTRNLDRVTQFGACTMCLDVSDTSRP